jgi:hypothetical protein
MSAGGLGNRNGYGVGILKHTLDTAEPIDGATWESDSGGLDLSGDDAAFSLLQDFRWLSHRLSAHGDPRFSVLYPSTAFPGSWGHTTTHAVLHVEKTAATDDFARAQNLLHTKIRPQTLGGNVRFWDCQSDAPVAVVHTLFETLGRLEEARQNTFQLQRMSLQGWASLLRTRELHGLARSWHRWRSMARDARHVVWVDQQMTDSVHQVVSSAASQWRTWSQFLLSFVDVLGRIESVDMLQEVVANHIPAIFTAECAHLLLVDRPDGTLYVPAKQSKLMRRVVVGQVGVGLCGKLVQEDGPAPHVVVVNNTLTSGSWKVETDELSAKVVERGRCLRPAHNHAAHGAPATPPSLKLGPQSAFTSTRNVICGSVHSPPVSSPAADGEVDPSAPWEGVAVLRIANCVEDLFGGSNFCPRELGVGTAKIPSRSSSTKSTSRWKAASFSKYHEQLMTLICSAIGTVFKRVSKEGKLKAVAADVALCRRDLRKSVAKERHTLRQQQLAVSVQTIFADALSSTSLGVRGLGNNRRRAAPYCAPKPAIFFRESFGKAIERIFSDVLSKVQFDIELNLGLGKVDANRSPSPPHDDLSHLSLSLSSISSDDSKAVFDVWRGTDTVKGHSVRVVKIPLQCTHSSQTTVVGTLAVWIRQATSDRELHDMSKQLTDIAPSVASCFSFLSAYDVSIGEVVHLQDAVQNTEGEVERLQNTLAGTVQTLETCRTGLASATKEREQAQNEVGKLQETLLREANTMKACQVHLQHVIRKKKRDENTLQFETALSGISRSAHNQDAASLRAALVAVTSPSTLNSPIDTLRDLVRSCMRFCGLEGHFFLASPMVDGHDGSVEVAVGFHERLRSDQGVATFDQILKRLESLPCLTAAAFEPFAFRLSVGAADKMGSRCGHTRSTFQHGLQDAPPVGGSLVLECQVSSVQALSFEDEAETPGLDDDTMQLRTVRLGRLSGVLVQMLFGLLAKERVQFLETSVEDYLKFTSWSSTCHTVSRHVAEKVLFNLSETCDLASSVGGLVQKAVSMLQSTISAHVHHHEKAGKSKQVGADLVAPLAAIYLDSPQLLSGAAEVQAQAQGQDQGDGGLRATVFWGNGDEVHESGHEPLSAGNGRQSPVASPEALLLQLGRAFTTHDSEEGAVSGALESWLAQNEAESGGMSTPYGYFCAVPFGASLAAGTNINQGVSEFGPSALRVAPSPRGCVLIFFPKTQASVANASVFRSLRSADYLHINNIAHAMASRLENLTRSHLMASEIARTQVSLDQCMLFNGTLKRWWGISLVVRSATRVKTVCTALGGSFLCSLLGCRTITFARVPAKENPDLHGNGLKVLRAISNEVGSTFRERSNVAGQKTCETFFRSNSGSEWCRRHIQHRTGGSLLVALEDCWEDSSGDAQHGARRKKVLAVDNKNQSRTDLLVIHIEGLPLQPCEGVRDHTAFLVGLLQDEVSHALHALETQAVREAEEVMSRKIANDQRSMRGVLRRMKHAHLMKGFRKWYDVAVVGGCVQKKFILRMQTYIYKRSYRLAWNSWTHHCGCVRDVEVAQEQNTRLVRRVVGRLYNGRMGQGFAKWMCVAEEAAMAETNAASVLAMRQRGVPLMRRCLRRILSRNIWKGWHQWLAYNRGCQNAARSVAVTKTVLRNALRRTRSHYTRRSLCVWKVYTEQLAHTEMLARRVIARWRKANLTLALHMWCHEVRRGRHLERDRSDRKRAVLRVMGLSRKHGYASAFKTWGMFARRRQRELGGLALFGRFMTHSYLSKVFNMWYDVARAGEQLKASRESRWKKLSDCISHINVQMDGGNSATTSKRVPKQQSPPQVDAHGANLPASVRILNGGRDKATGVLNTRLADLCAHVSRQARSLFQASGASLFFLKRPAILEEGCTLQRVPKLWTSRWPKGSKTPLTLWIPREDIGPAGNALRHMQTYNISKVPKFCSERLPTGASLLCLPLLLRYDDEKSQRRMVHLLGVIEVSKRRARFQTPQDELVNPPFDNDDICMAEVWASKIASSVQQYFMDHALRIESLQHQHSLLVQSALLHLRSIWKRVHMLPVQRCFSAWKCCAAESFAGSLVATTTTQKRAMSLLRLRNRRVRQMRSQRVCQGWRRWQQYARGRQNTAYLLSGMVLALRKDAMRSAVSLARRAVSLWKMRVDELVRAEQLLERVIKRWRKVHLVTAFRTWKQWHQFWERHHMDEQKEAMYSQVESAETQLSETRILFKSISLLQDAAAKEIKLTCHSLADLAEWVHAKGRAYLTSYAGCSGQDHSLKIFWLLKEGPPYGVGDAPMCASSREMWSLDGAGERVACPWDQTGELDAVWRETGVDSDLLGECLRARSTVFKRTDFDHSNTSNGQNRFVALSPILFDHLHPVGILVGGSLVNDCDLQILDIMSFHAGAHVSYLWRKNGLDAATLRLSETEKLAAGESSNLETERMECKKLRAENAQLGQALEKIMCVSPPPFHIGLVDRFQPRIQCFLSEAPLLLTPLTSLCHFTLFPALQLNMKNRLLSARAKNVENCRRKTNS